MQKLKKEGAMQKLLLINTHLFTYFRLIILVHIHTLFNIHARYESLLDLKIKERNKGKVL